MHCAQAQVCTNNALLIRVFVILFVDGSFPAFGFIVRRWGEARGQQNFTEPFFWRVLHVLEVEFSWILLEVSWKNMSFHKQI